MKFNFGHLTKISSNPEYSVLRHPDGHEIKISHAHLSPEMRSQLEKVPKAFQQGGDTTPDETPYGNEEAAAQQASDQAPPMEGTETSPQSTEQAPQTTPAPDISTLDQKQIQSATQLPSEKEIPKDIFGAQAYTQQYLKGLGEFEKGAGQEAKSEIAYQNLMRPTYEAQAKKIDTQANIALEVQKQNQERTTALMDSLYTKDPVTGKLIPPHIDPNQYWEDKSIPGKISTIIGLIAGGIGGGILHEENPALKMLNTQIDRNMMAQNMNIDNKLSLLNANRETIGNEAAAQGMTRVMLNDQVVNSASQAIAKTTDQRVIGRLQQLIGSKNMESAQIISQNAAIMSMAGGTQVPQQPGGPQGSNYATQNPEAMIEAWSRYHPNDKDPMMKELTEARMMSNFKDNVLSSFDQARDLVRSSNVMNPQLGERLNAINSPVLASLSKDTAGRFTDTDSRYLSPLQVNRMDKIKPGSEEKTWGLKRSKLNQLVNTKMNFPRLKFLGIDPDSFGTYDRLGNRRFTRLPPQVPKKVKTGSFGSSGSY